MRRGLIDSQWAVVLARPGLFLVLIATAGAAAESFSAGLAKAAALLRDGNAADALAA